MRRIISIITIVLGFGIGYYELLKFNQENPMAENALKVEQENQNTAKALFYTVCHKMNKEILGMTDSPDLYCNCLFQTIKNDEAFETALKHIDKNVGVKRIYQLLSTSHQKTYFECAEQHISDTTKIKFNSSLKTKYINQLTSEIRTNQPPSDDINIERLSTCIIEEFLITTPAKDILQGAFQNKALIQEAYDNCYLKLKK